MAGGGELEPRDSRNVTGTASTPDGRWTNREGQPPLANGQPPEVKGTEEVVDEAEVELDDEDEDDEEGDVVRFIMDPKLRREIEGG